MMGGCLTQSFLPQQIHTDIITEDCSIILDITGNRHTLLVSSFNVDVFLTDWREMTGNEAVHGEIRVKLTADGPVAQWCDCKVCFQPVTGFMLDLQLQDLVSDVSRLISTLHLSVCSLTFSHFMSYLLLFDFTTCANSHLRLLIGSVQGQCDGLLVMWSVRPLREKLFVWFLCPHWFSLWARKSVPPPLWGFHPGLDWFRIRCLCVRVRLGLGLGRG